MSVLDNVDAATNLAKNNELQLLVFRINENEESAYYAINVFKTREVGMGRWWSHPGHFNLSLLQIDVNVLQKNF